MLISSSVLSLGLAAGAYRCGMPATRGRRAHLRSCVWICCFAQIAATPAAHVFTVRANSAPPRRRDRLGHLHTPTISCTVCGPSHRETPPFNTPRPHTYSLTSLAAELSSEQRAEGRGRRRGGALDGGVGGACAAAHVELGQQERAARHLLRVEVELPPERFIGFTRGGLIGFMGGGAVAGAIRTIRQPSEILQIGRSGGRGYL